MQEWVDTLKKASPKSYSETFDDQVHGWMTSRYALATMVDLDLLTPGVELTSTTSTNSKNTCAAIVSCVPSSQSTCEEKRGDSSAAHFRRLPVDDESFYVSYGFRNGHIQIKLLGAFILFLYL